MKRNIIRLFTKPKSWRAKGNMELEELLLLSLYYPDIAEPEIQKRHAIALAGYHSVVRAQVILISILSQLTGAFIALFAWHHMMLLCADAALLSAVMILLMMADKRAEILWDNTNDCYGWLLDEVLYPAPFEILEPLQIAFRRFCEKDRRREDTEERKFKWFVRGYGYNLTTIRN